MRLLNPVCLLSAIMLCLVACIDKSVPDQWPVPSEPLLQQAVIDAALRCDVIVVAQALANGYAADARDEDGRTLLMYAAYNGCVAVGSQLLDAGADVNAADPHGTTILMFAASGHNPDMVQLLLNRGAKINAVDGGDHFTALMWAASEGQVEVVEVLLGAGADSTLLDVDGDSAESFAAKNGHPAVVKILQKIDQKSPQKEIQ